MLDVASWSCPNAKRSERPRVMRGRCRSDNHLGACELTPSPTGPKRGQGQDLMENSQTPAKGQTPDTALTDAPADELDAFFAGGELPPEEERGGPQGPPTQTVGVFALHEEGLSAALAHCDIGLRYNTRARAIEHTLDKDWTPVTDRTEAKIRKVLAQECAAPRGDKLIDYRLNETEWRNFRDAHLADNEVDPVLDYILECSMTAIPYPATKRPNLLAEAGFIIDDALYSPAYQTWLAWLPLWTVVRRALSERPVQIDVIPVLIGANRIGKTTYYKRHVPEERGWIAEGFNWRLSHKEKLENAGDAALVLADEMFAAGADIDGLKAWLSFTTPRMRMAYDRHASVHWPKYALVGLSNAVDALPDDPTSSNRFAVIEVSGTPYETPKEVTDYWDAERSRIWATAYRDVIKGIDHIVPPRELRTKQKDAAEWHSYEDEDVSIVREWLRHNRPARISLREAAKSAKLDTDLIARGHYDRKLRKAFVAEGYKPRQTRLEGKKQRYWERVPDVPDVPDNRESDYSKDAELDPSSHVQESPTGGTSGTSGTELQPELDDGEPF